MAVGDDEMVIMMVVVVMMPACAGPTSMDSSGMLSLEWWEAVDMSARWTCKVDMDHSSAVSQQVGGSQH